METFLVRARMHGVVPLLHAAGLPPGAPIELHDACRAESIERAMWELRHQQVVTEALASLVSAGLNPVLIKGSALAYSVYPSPAMRGRADTDIVIPARQRDAAFAALEASGFRREFGVAGEFVSYQSNFNKDTGDRIGHTLDVHWKMNNSRVLAGLLSCEEALDDSSDLPSLSPEARAASPVHSLLIAVFHRASHIHNPYYVDGVAHYGGDRLIWLYDIHLLAHALTPVQWQSFCALVDHRAMSAVCLAALRAAQACLGTSIPADVASRLASARQETLPARYIAAGKLRQQWMDFQALDNWASRSRYLGELLFPGPGYMRGRYPGQHRWLAWLYLRRAVTGAYKTLGLGRTSS